MKKTIVFDFDGVIHSYRSGWKGANNIPDAPVDGIKNVINTLRKDGYEVVVVSARCSEPAGITAIEHWLHVYDIQVDRVCKEKPPAIVYVDDRAICFNGNTSGLVDEIKNFKNWLS